MIMEHRGAPPTMSEAVEDRCTTSSKESAPRSSSTTRPVGPRTARNASLLVLERDDSVLAHDQHLLYQQIRIAGCADTLTDRHERAQSNPLLAITGGGLEPATTPLALS